ncbi:MAG: sulfite oxidase [Pseudomonadota bacterium]
MASRRQMLTWSAALGAPIVFNLPNGLVPIALAQEGVDKPGLRTLSDRPLNMETPAHLLDDAATPRPAMFVRNNGYLPEISDPAEWRLEITGLVDTPLSLSIADLKAHFAPVTYRLQMECGGNGRAFFSPGASGNQWTFGAIACPDWTGVRLKDVLAAAGVQDGAIYTGHYGADTHLSGDPDKAPISRGVPIAKALEEHSMIAWAMNGADMPVANGHPLRLVIPGWPGSCSQKWLTRINVRGQVHDGPKMGGQSYRVPAYPVAPGAQVPDADMVIIESMPIKSLITFPKTGVRRSAGKAFEVRGHAWAGDRSVKAMEVSIDFGRTWQPAALSAPINRYAWQQWRAPITVPSAGYYEIWARATDDQGIAQPPVPPEWNPRGYLNNMQHRIAVIAL